MDDLISRQAAIDALDKVAEMFPYKIPGKAKTYRQYNEAWSDACDASARAVEGLPSAQTEMPWIPCSKKLPEKEGPYLISNSRHTFEAMFLGGEWYSRELDLLLDGVLAWMFLPEPYKAESEGKE